MNSELHAAIESRQPPEHRGFVPMDSADRTLTQPDVASARPVDALTPPESAPRPITSPHVDGHIGHYEIIRTLGAGGMGTVILARDTKLARLVAIKLFGDSGEAASRLLAEARATAQARHENIVVIYEVGTFQGRPYMVLEYLEGRTLRQVISSARQGRPLSRGFALEIMVSVIRALASVHQSGLVHRDLKPENIMLLNSGQVKVLDFGIAKSVESTVSNERQGTRPYMSPEQWRGDDVDQRSDLWAAGVILYELLAQEHPLAPFTPHRLASIVDFETPMPHLRDVRPDLEGLSDVVDRCLRKRKEERFASADELLADLEPFLARSKQMTVGEADRPFTGLAAFQESDGDRFFGRDRDIMAVLALLQRQPLVTVAGASGAGKSSFVRAGLIPALKRSGEDWHVVVVRPGRAPLIALKEAARADGDLDLRAFPIQFGALLRARCRALGEAQRFLVFVDQLEELYTLVNDTDERAAFFACLLGAADDASSPVRVVSSIRSDFLDRIVQDRRFMAHVATGLFFLPPMDAAGQRDALTRPVEAAGYAFESETLVDSILVELMRANNPLPLLQFTATRLWDARDTDRKLLTQQAYAQMGGVGGALATHADTVVSSLSASDQRLCRAILTSLVTPERTRAVVYLRELLALDEDAAAVQTVVQQLAAARLLLVDADADAGGAKIEIVHESLIDRWPTLGRWLDESAKDAHFLARLRVAALQWDAGGKPTGMLWRDLAADEARAFYERYRQGVASSGKAFVGALDEQYLKAVIALSERGRRTRNRAISMAFVLVCAIALVVSFLSIDARKQARRADEEAARVRDQNAQLSYQALRGRNATRILAARKNQDDPTTALAILREVEAPDIPRDWPELVSAAFSTGVACDVWRSDPTRCAYSAVMSPDGTSIAVAMDDHTTRILGTDLVERAVLRGHEKLVWTAAWSPDSKRVVTASFDNTARLWFADGNGEPLVLRGHQDALNSAKVSPDGNRILTASDDRTARIWSAEDGRELLVLRHDSEINFADWSPDGKRIVTTSTDGLGRVWNADGKGEPLLLRGHVDMVIAASFHPDGKRIATAGLDRAVRIWDAQNGRENLVLRGHEEKILSVAWSPDGKHIASSSKDKTAMVWRADGRGAPIVLRGHQHWVYTATWSPDSRQVITTSLDGTQRRFRIEDIVAPTLLRGHEDAIRGLDFAPDGKRIATVSMDTTARIWSVDGNDEAVVLRGHTSSVTFVRWSPDGARLATVSEDKTARIWTVDGSAAPVALGGSDTVLHSVYWSPDGERLVTASAGGTSTLWSKAGVEISRVQKKVSLDYKRIHAPFDVSGKRVLVLDTSDKTVYVWNVDERADLVPLGDLDGPVRIAKWSPDGSQIIAITHSGNARIWDVRGQAAPVDVRASKVIRNAAWSPDGRRLVFSLVDGTLLPYAEGVFGEPIASGVADEGVTQLNFSPDGLRILTATPYGKVRVRNADGTGSPFVLEGVARASAFAYWSPSGDRIALSYEDNFAWVWPDIRPFAAPNEARLWTATTYCVPRDKRIALFGVSEDEARAGEEACRRQVAEVRGANQPR